MEKIVMVFVLSMAIFCSCTVAQKTNISDSELTFQKQTHKIPLEYFLKFICLKETVEREEIESAQQLIERYTRYDTNYYAFPAHRSISDLGDGCGFNILELPNGLICLVLKEGDNVIDMTDLSFFTMNNGVLNDVTSMVFSGISFSDFYDCTYDKDSLNSQSNYYYMADFYMEQAAVVLKIYYAEPMDYYDEAIGNISYDELCAHKEPIYYRFEKGKFVRCTTANQKSE